MAVMFDYGYNRDFDQNLFDILMSAGSVIILTHIYVQISDFEHVP